MPFCGFFFSHLTFLLRHFRMLTFPVSKSGDGAVNGLSPIKVSDSLSPMKTSIDIGANTRMWEERQELLCLRRVAVGSLAFGSSSWASEHNVCAEVKGCAHVAC